MKTSEAIKQRHVDPSLVSFHEGLGVCFGRQATGPDLRFIELQSAPSRHL